MNHSLRARPERPSEHPLRKPPAYAVEHDSALDGREGEGLYFWVIIADVANSRSWEVEFELDPECPGEIASVRLLAAADGEGDFRPIGADRQDVKHGRLHDWLTTAPVMRRYAAWAHEQWVAECEQARGEQ